MKKIFVALSGAAVCTLALAQPPAGLVDRPTAEEDPMRSGGVAQQAAETNRTGVMVLVPPGHPADLDRDGMITQVEWAEWNTRVMGAGPARTPAIESGPVRPGPQSVPYSPD